MSLGTSSRRQIDGREYFNVTLSRCTEMGGAADRLARRVGLPNQSTGTSSRPGNPKIAKVKGITLGAVGKIRYERPGQVRDSSELA